MNTVRSERSSRRDAIALLQRYLPKSLRVSLREIQFALPTVEFLLDASIPLTIRDRLGLLVGFHRVSCRVPGEHTPADILQFVTAILSIPSDVPGYVVEAGAFKGASTAKFSLAVRAVRRNLVVFDSFEGIPENTENHRLDIHGKPVGFVAGDYRGSKDEVVRTLTQYGSVSNCELVEGWFDETLPAFNRPVAAAYLDVDLVSSTRTCIKYIYPLLQPGGVLMSQDGHLPLVVELLDDARFWKHDVGVDKPTILGLRRRKVVVMRKPR